MSALAERVRRYAERLGSRATTMRGQVRAVLAHGAIPHATRPWGIRHTPRSARWTETQREDLRAGADTRFRHALLARLRREMAVPRTLTLGSVTAWVDRFAVRVAARDRLSRLIGRPVDKPSLDFARIHRLPNGAGIAARLGATICRRGAAPVIAPCFGSSDWTHTDGETEWRNGRAVRYTRAKNESYYRSFGIVSPAGDALAVAIHDREYALPAPAGTRWEIDPLGIRLLDPVTGADYHPSASECWSARADAAAILGLLRDAEETRARAEWREIGERQRVAATRASDLAEAEGVTVGLSDSVAGGNCEAGSRVWATQHGLDVTRWYRASALLASANGEYVRVRGAVLAAIRRQRVEETRAAEMAAE